MISDGGFTDDEDDHEAHLYEALDAHERQPFTPQKGKIYTEILPSLYQLADQHCTNASFDLNVLSISKRIANEKLSK